MKKVQKGSRYLFQNSYLKKISNKLDDFFIRQLGNVIWPEKAYQEFGKFSGG